MKEESRIESIMPAPGWRCYTCEAVGQEDGSNKFEITEYQVLGLALVRCFTVPHSTVEFLILDPADDSIKPSSKLDPLRGIKIIPPGQKLSKWDRKDLEMVERRRVKDGNRANS